MRRVVNEESGCGPNNEYMFCPGVVIVMISNDTCVL